jgi:recombination protein RecR
VPHPESHHPFASEHGDPLARLVALLSRLPGIGEKSATRLALALVRSDPEYVAALGAAVSNIHNLLGLCRVCCDLTADSLCPRCRDPRRDHSVVCVVAQPQDRMVIERSGAYRGLYHVLHGVLDPLGGSGPSDLKIEPLLRRLARSGSQATEAPGALAQSDPLETDAQIQEVIVATSPNVEGDATALYLSKLIQPLGIRVTRIASGVAVGGELEYADHTTLCRALEDRRAI